MGQTDGQTDAQQMHRPGAAHYAGSANIYNVSQQKHNITVTTSITIYTPQVTKSTI